MMPNEEKQMSDLSRHDISMTDSPVEADSDHSEDLIANLFDGRRNGWKFFLYECLIGVFLWGLAFDVIKINFWIGGFIAGVCDVFHVSNIIKRLHDINKSAGWCIPILILDLIADIPAISQIILVLIIRSVAGIILLLYPGTEGCNRYGKA